MKKIHLLLFGFIALLPLKLLAQKQFIATPVNRTVAPSLTSIFKNFALFDVPTKAMADFVQANGKDFSNFELEFQGYARFPLSIYQQDILSSNYKLIVGNEQGRQVFPKPDCMTYTGTLTNDAASIVALSITPSFFYGMLKGNGKAYFIEPLKNFDRNADATTFVVYETKDVIPQSGNMCGVTEAENRLSQTAANRILGSATGTCKMTEMAIASDDSMVLRYGSVADVQQHNISVMNIVNTIYGNAQLGPQYLQFTIKGQYVSTSAATNPTTPVFSGNNASTLLSRFAAWGNANNFGFTFDIGQFWTTRDIDYLTIVGTDTTHGTGTIGLAYVGGTCSSAKYQLIEDAVTGYLRGVLVAHETGHNFGANHDASGAPYIMAPSVSNVTDFSPASITAMTNFLASSQSSCLAVCTAMAPVADFDVSSNGLCGPGSITFTNTSSGTITSVSWSFPEGNPSTSTASNPTVSFATTGLKQATLTVSNATGSSTYTKTILVGNAPPTACRTTVTGNANSATLFSFNLGGIAFTTNTFYPDQTKYFDLACQNKTILASGTAYTGTTRIGLLQGTYNIADKMDLFIDYNNDGDFLDAGEYVYSTTPCTQGTIPFGFTTPANPPVTGAWLRMRMISLPCGVANTNGCSIPANSQIYDFGVAFASPCITYVNAAASGANNGTSWTDAYTSLSPALSAGAPCTAGQVWVAAGTYKPTTGIDRSLSFSMKNGLSILGGFPNTGNPSMAQRNPATNITTLSGDIGGTGVSDNSYHVINNSSGLTNSAVMDGFVITGGNANGPGGFQNMGGAVFNNGGGTGGVCSPKFERCIFTNNLADSGGAVYNCGFNSGTSSPTFTNCIFQNNTATNKGGAAYNDGRSAGKSNPEFINCSFSNNTASLGTVLYNIGTGGTSLPIITNNIFYGNGGSNTFINTAATITATNNLFEPAVNNYINTAGNITSATSPFVAATNLHLKDASTAIDAGTATGATSIDIDSTIRTSVPDIGAYENPQTCAGSNKTYWSDVIGTAYQWQVFNGSDFVDLVNGASYANVSTNKLTVIAPANTATGTRFRCAVTTGTGIVYSSEITLRFYNRWLGTTDNNWLNIANWSCGTLPTQYTDVILPSAKTIYPLTNVGGTIRRLQTESGSSVTVKTGSTLIVVGQD